ncbi:MAG TPA: LysR family transcriptional regulator [Chloroflexota bacterium]|nr:LysR family transcriptional regulator [Chloroflexota bacterium]
MNLHQLELFLAVATQGSVTRAAEVLHISQPAISARLRDLEASLGEQLFELRGRRIYLTDAGVELRAYAETILRQVEEAQRAVAELRGLDRGMLRVVATTTVGTYVLPRILGRFHRAHPGITLVLDVTNERRALDLVRRRRMDLAVLGLTEDTADMVVEHFMENHLFITAAPEHPLARREAVAFAELAGYPLLVREEGSGTRAVMESIFAERQLTPHIAMEMRHSAAIKQAVMAGLGVGLLSDQEMHVELASGTLVTLDIEGLTLRRDWHVMHQRDRRLPHAAAAFKQLLLAYAAEQSRHTSRSDA